MTEVEDILNNKKIRYIPKGKDLLVLCFNPEHEDSNPSMRIDRVDGRYHCFSCGYKGDLFHDFNKHRNIFTGKVQKLLDSIKDLKKSAGISLPADAFSFVHGFRGLSPDTLVKFEAFTSDKEFPNRVVFPIKDASGTVIGMLGRYKDSNANPKYLSKPSKVSLPLFPTPKEVEPINNSIVLVEGLIDSLNLYDKGLKNSVCIFGTSQLSKDNIKDKLMPYMLLGIDKVYLMLDADDAGRKASKRLESIINYNTDLVVEMIPLSEGSDPGDLNQSDVDSIKSYLLNK